MTLAPGLLRIQCKWAPKVGNVVAVNLTSSRHSTRGSIRTTYQSDEIDGVVAYCDQLKCCYFIPVELVAGRRAIRLRLGPPKNGQRACINLAQAFEFPGAIAQLGERVAGSDEVVGSSPTGSITRFDGVAAVQLGAHEFRERFGYYMELAAAGKDLTVTRHGRPFVRLTGAQPKLATDDRRDRD